MRREQIAFGVANEEGILKDEVMLGLGLKQQTRLRFPARAVISGLVGAIVNRLYSSSLCINLVYKPTSDFLQIHGGHQAFPNSRLIGNDDHVVILGSQKTQRIKGAGQENKLLPGRNIAANDALIDDSVAVS